MEIRKLKLDKELIYPDEGGEIIKCPVCSAVWMEDDHHADPPCSHLRFCYCTVDPGFVFFVGEWDHSNFESAFEDLAFTEDEIDELRAFQELEHPGVDAIVYWDDDDFPLVQWSTYWGYKAD